MKETKYKLGDLVVALATNRVMIVTGIIIRPDKTQYILDPLPIPKPLEAT